jgi:hypothetical protein
MMSEVDLKSFEADLETITLRSSHVIYNKSELMNLSFKVLMLSALASINKVG